MKQVAPNMSITSTNGSRKTRKDNEREKEKESDETDPTVFEEISTPIRPASRKHGCEDEGAKMIHAPTPPTDDTPKFIDSDLKKEQLGNRTLRMISPKPSH
uniref:Uncharacterized protein n=1 Tax=Steinernema glaseri TaxID=37863 RepID=A0A1I7YI33_9BILA